VRQTAFSIADAVLAWEVMRKQRRQARSDRNNSLKSKGPGTEDSTVEGAMSEDLGVKRKREENLGDQKAKSSRSLEGDGSYNVPSGPGADGAQGENNPVLSSSSQPRVGDTSTAGAPSAGAVLTSSEREDELTISFPMIQIIANFLFRQGFLTAENSDTAIKRLFPRSLHLFRRLVTIHPVIRMVKLFPHVEKLMHSSAAGGGSGSHAHHKQDSHHSGPMSSRALAVYAAFMLSSFNAPTFHLDVNTQPSSAFLSNISLLRELLPALLSSSSMRVQRLSSSLVCKVDWQTYSSIHLVSYRLHFHLNSLIYCLIMIVLFTGDSGSTSCCWSFCVVLIVG